MVDLFQKYNFELSPEELKKFQKFLEIFMKINSQINLSAIRDAEGIIEKHFIDSLMVAVFIDITGPHPTSSYQGEEQTTFSSLLDNKGIEGVQVKVADMGTGGGFPGIPLAITHPETQFTLIDSVAKKLKCVEDFSYDLGLKNVATLVGRAEDIGQDSEHREQYDMVVSRATAYLPTLLEYSLPLLKIGGILAAYKLTDKEEFHSIKKALSRLGGKILKIKNYDLSGQNRSIVFIEKISSTHKKYPRKVGIPLKYPII